MYVVQYPNSEVIHFPPKSSIVSSLDHNHCPSTGSQVETKEAAIHNKVATATPATMIHSITKGEASTTEPEQPQSSSSAATKAAAVAAALAPTPAPTSRRRKKAKQQTPPSKDMIPLHPNFQPAKLDVICSRGKFAYNSPGNCWFRMMVEEQMDNYSNARTKTDKSLVVSVLINRVRHANPEGGFVKNYGGRWYCVSDRYSREKVGQQFRDLLHTKYRSSTKAKAEKRKKQQTGEYSPDCHNSSSSIDEENSSKSTRERLQHTSPRHSPASTPGSTTSLTKLDPTKGKMPALDLHLQPDVNVLQPRNNPSTSISSISSSIKRAPDAGEEQPTISISSSQMPPLEDGNMDLEYLDDYEPLPMLNSNGTRANRSNSLDLDLMSGLQDSFPNVFNPPDLHQSLPDGFFRPHGDNHNHNSSEKVPQPEDPSDPFYQPWHMSI